MQLSFYALDHALPFARLRSLVKQLSRQSSKYRAKHCSACNNSFGGTHSVALGILNVRKSSYSFGTGGFKSTGCCSGGHK
jgi:hypothetical protein